MDESAMGPITTDDEFSETTWNTRDVNQGGRVMDNIARQRITETHIRKQDASDLVDEYHGFEDLIVRLETENEELKAVLQDAVDWIEDDRFDDDYIIEQWYQDAIDLLGLKMMDVVFRKKIKDLKATRKKEE
jgi:hypothetical protein